jgi:hypothetical protein
MNKTVCATAAIAASLFIAASATSCAHNDDGASGVIPATPEYIEASKIIWANYGNPGPRPWTILVTDLDCAWDDVSQQYLGFMAFGRCLSGYAQCPFNFVAYWGQLPSQSSQPHEHQHCAVGYKNLSTGGDPDHMLINTWEECQYIGCVGHSINDIKEKGL